MINKYFCEAVSLCSLAYAKNKVIERGLFHKGYVDIHFIEKKLYKGFIAYNPSDNKCYLALSGVPPGTFLRSGVQLLTWKLQSHNNSKVYSTFLYHADSLKDILDSYIEKYPTASFMYTGHSLGAAICTILCLHKAPTMLVTYGSPKVGDKHFVRNLDKLKINHFRFVACNDDVTTLPLWCYGLKHHGAEIYINFYGHIRDSTKFQKSKDKFRAKISMNKAHSIYKAHNIDNYYYKILKAYR